MKKWLIGIALIAIGAAVFYGVRGKNTESVLRFQYGEIKRGDLESLVSSTGTIGAVGTVDVGAQVSGTLESVFVDYNDRVEKGQLLAVLETSLLDASVRDAQANVMKAEAQLHQSEAELKRNQDLFQKKYISESEFLVIQTNLEMARASLKSAEAALNRAQVNRKYAEIKSPISGTVIERSIEAGQTIASGFQTPQLFIIAEDLRRMQIEVLVDESDISSIRENLPARFTVQAYPDEVFHGTVKQIRLQPQTVQNVVSYVVIVDAPNDENKLLPGMTATVEFVIDSQKDIMLVANAAVYFQPDMDALEKSGIQLESGRNPENGKTGKQPKRNSKANHGDKNEKLETVFYMTDDHTIKSIVFEPGISDSTTTEIKRIVNGPEQTEGLKVITGTVGESKSQTRSMSGMGFPMGPPPSAGRGMRHAGL